MPILLYYRYEKEDEASKMRMKIYNICMDKPVLCDGGLDFVLPRFEAKNRPCENKHNCSKGSCPDGKCRCRGGGPYWPKRGLINKVQKKKHFLIIM